MELFERYLLMAQTAILWLHSHLLILSQLQWLKTSTVISPALHHADIKLLKIV